MRISLVTLNLLSPDGSRVIIGGLERYTLDLALLIRNLGHEVDIHQWASSNWVVEYKGLRVYGHSRNNPSLTERIERSTSDRVIYTWIGQQLKYKPDCISICHGIWFDYEHNGIDPARSIYITNALLNSTVVSVDLNFINWIRASLGRKYADPVYIPNYVDFSLFKPKGAKETSGRFTILYPRRLDKFRGIDLFQRVVDNLYDRYDIEFHFAIDRNHSQALLEFKKWAGDRPRITYRHYLFDEMVDAYSKADIVVIPTYACEGTSLSCLEAMACGKAIVSTDVGGLSNLIIDGHNGLLVPPNADSIEKAIVRLIEDEALRGELEMNAYKVSRVFSKEKWESRWKALMSSMWGVE